MNSQIQITLPAWFVQDDLRMIDTVISKVSPATGIAIATENFDGTKRCDPTVRIYMMRLYDGEYELAKELEAFPFDTVAEAQLFVSKLPEMTAIDLIMLLNKEEPVFSM